jgi:hypothetical protein
LVLPFGVRGNVQQPPAAASRPAAAHQAVLSKYCYTCHNDKVKSGGLALTTLDISAPAKHSERGACRSQTGDRRHASGTAAPGQATADSLVRYLKRISTVWRWPILTGIPRAAASESRRIQGAIRDLPLDIDVTAMLPPDTASFGFDNNADALTLSPALTERYLSAAAKISQVALTRPRGIPTPETFFEPTDRNVGTRVSDEMPFGTRGGIALHYLFPADGDYLIETRRRERRKRRVRKLLDRSPPARRHRQRQVWSAGWRTRWTGTNRLGRSGPSSKELDR